MAETYIGNCVAVQGTIQSCASRVDSLRTECTKSYGSLTAWPGPCECTYYAQDLMCFDEPALCASQAWSQVPAWFRDGVTTCLAKDAAYTIRAQLGAFSNPFTVSGLAGSLQRAQSTTAGPGSTSSLPTQTTTPGAETNHLSSGTVAGIVVGAPNASMSQKGHTTLCNPSDPEGLGHTKARPMGEHEQGGECGCLTTFQTASASALASREINSSKTS